MNPQGPVTFGNDPFFGTLAVALPDLAPNFGGDIVTLTVLDLFVSRKRCSIQPVNSLEEAFWMRLKLHAMSQNVEQDTK